jgi:copper homeostasis protein
MQVQVEVCVSSVEEAEVAVACGADRLEICSWLACGGITPSSGLVDTVRNAVRVPVRVLVRPTPGGFNYSAAETAVLLTDAEVFGGGALGLVTGALTEAGGLHSAIMRSVIGLAPESEITFHRAIDRSTDPICVVDECVGLGIDRILTSGGATLAIDGVTTIQRIIKQAGDRCSVTIAGGIGPANVVELVERTGAREIHFAAQRTISGPVPGASMSSSQAGMNFLSEPDAAKIEGVLNALIKAGLR